jgi:hypothetical protein
MECLVRVNKAFRGPDRGCSMSIIRSCIGFILVMAVCVAFVYAINAFIEIVQYA